jgi:hypothetical protein
MSFSKCFLYKQAPGTGGPALGLPHLTGSPGWVAAKFGCGARHAHANAVPPAAPQHMWEASARHPPTHANVPKQSN